MLKQERHEDVPLAPLCIEAACMEIPQRVMMPDLCLRYFINAEIEYFMGHFYNGIDLVCRNPGSGICFQAKEF